MLIHSIRYVILVYCSGFTADRIHSDSSFGAPCVLVEKTSFRSSDGVEIMSDPEEPKRFKVTDRRAFTPSGERRDDAESERSESAAVEPEPGDLRHSVRR